MSHARHFSITGLIDFFIVLLADGADFASGMPAYG
jgi:hypothetical protein